MQKYNTIGVDLAKNIIHVSVINTNQKEILNRSFGRLKFAEFPAKQKPM